MRGVLAPYPGLNAETASSKNKSGQMHIREVSRNGVALQRALCCSRGTSRDGTLNPKY